MKKIKKVISKSVEFINHYCFVLFYPSFEKFHKCIIAYRSVLFCENSLICFDKEIRVKFCKSVDKESFASFPSPINQEPFVYFFNLLFLQRSKYNHGKYNAHDTYKVFFFETNHLNKPSFLPIMAASFLPTTRDEGKKYYKDFKQFDVIFVTGDPYYDHPLDRKS